MYILAVDRRCLEPNTLNTQVRNFYNLGRYSAMSIIQGGSGLPFLAELVYNYLCTGECTGLAIQTEEVPDPTVRFVLKRVGDTSD